jgi:hypothetical protein
MGDRRSVSIREHCGCGAAVRFDGPHLTALRYVRRWRGAHTCTPPPFDGPPESGSTALAERAPIGFRVDWDGGVVGT